MDESDTPTPLAIVEEVYQHKGCCEEFAGHHVVVSMSVADGVFYRRVPICAIGQSGLWRLH